MRAEGGYIVPFQEQVDKLQVSIHENLSRNFTSKDESLLIYIPQSLNLFQLVKPEKKVQHKPIEDKLATSEQTGYGYIGKQGLVGGIKRKAREEDKKEKEHANRGSISKHQRLLTDEGTALGDFSILPIELLQMILADVPFPQILDVIRINHTFYELITGYTQVGLLGVANRPNPVFYSHRWLNNKNIDFRGHSVDSISSVLFYCWMGKAKNLTEGFWPYLPQTHIHTLDLYGNKIGRAGVQALAKVLPNTQVHTLDLSENQIGAVGVNKLAEVLPQTLIHTL